LANLPTALRHGPTRASLSFESFELHNWPRLSPEIPNFRIIFELPPLREPQKNKNRDLFGIAACGTFMIANLLTLRQHTIRFAATRKPVAVSKREAKSAGVHAPCIVVRFFPPRQAG
jgi:hypothetical protein